MKYGNNIDNNLIIWSKCINAIVLSQNYIDCSFKRLRHFNNAYIGLKDVSKPNAHVKNVRVWRWNKWMLYAVHANLFFFLAKSLKEKLICICSSQRPKDSAMLNENQWFSIEGISNKSSFPKIVITYARHNMQYLCTMHYALWAYRFYIEQEKKVQLVKSKSQQVKILD